MNDYRKDEIAVGAFVLVGVAALLYLTLSLGGFRPWAGGARYSLHARFANVGDLAESSPVRLAGVDVGAVTAVELEGYDARVTLEVRDGLTLPADTSASIETEGLLGDAFLALTPGGATDDLAPGDTLSRTEPPLNLRELVGKYAFGSGTGSDPDESSSERDTESPFEEPLK